jgi:hypothetical protein
MRLVMGCAILGIVINATPTVTFAVPDTSAAVQVRNVNNLRTDSDSGHEGGASAAAFVNDPGFGAASGAAIASPGTLGVVAATSGFGLADAGAAFTLFDVTFAGPTAAVETDHIFRFDGSLSAAGDGSASVKPEIFFIWAPGQGVHFVGCMDAPRFSSCSTSFPFSFDLSNSNNALIHTPTFTVPTFVPVRFTTLLNVRAASGLDGGSAAASFGNTMGFPTSGPVFTLPEGYTVNSADGSIQNNRFVGASTAVPEPGTLALLGVGALTLGVYRRRWLGRYSSL